MTVLQDHVSDGQVNPGQLQQAIYSLTLRSFPLVPHWLTTMGVCNLPGGHLLFPCRVSFFLPSQLTSTFFKKDFLANVSFLPASCLPKESAGA